MQAQNKVLCADYLDDDHEQNAELIDVLTAISIVSKRLAKKLAKLESAFDGGGDSDV